LLFSLVSFGQAPDKDKVIAGAERAFEKASKANAAPAPGCAVGVSLNGQSVFEKAFGLAEMEHNIPNTPQTIFESGSVAKQFTAAALVLLQQDGKLSIDDPVRKYVTEFPDYGKPLTIRHILNHTAGLRDWGSVMALTGAGRGDRVVTQDIALDVIVRQKSLDFEPGAEYSYSNSGYQLAAIIVERVSGKKFSEFVAERIFKPLGMTNSSWRDDYRRLVIGPCARLFEIGAELAVDAEHADHECVRKRRHAYYGRGLAEMECGTRRENDGSTVCGSARDAGRVERRAKDQLRSWSRRGQLQRH
jgi:CubicO group peptidase (beta-lactamase class C family)